MYDVVISGAGPAGSKCAETLAGAGYKVALIEKNTKWRKPCGGALSSKAIRLYPQIKRSNRALISEVVIYSPDNSKIEVEIEPKKYLIVVDRLEFDDFARNLAVERGAKLFDNNLAYDFIWKNYKPIGIKTKTTEGSKEYLGKLLIIADGMSSKLALKSNLRTKWQTEQIGIAKCVIVEGKNTTSKRSIYGFFRKYLGYGWIFPLGNNRFNIGLGVTSKDILNHSLNEAYNEFINDAVVQNYISIIKSKLIWKGSYPMPVCGVLKDSLYSDNLMIIGDAAGFCSPINGEGISYSITSGKAAAEVSIQALEEDNCSTSILKNYKEHPEIQKIIKDFKFKLSMVKMIYGNKGESLNKMLKSSQKDSSSKEQLINAVKRLLI